MFAFRTSPKLIAFFSLSFSPEKASLIFAPKRVKTFPFSFASWLILLSAVSALLRSVFILMTRRSASPYFSAMSVMPCLSSATFCFWFSICFVRTFCSPAAFFEALAFLSKDDETSFISLSSILLSAMISPSAFLNAASPSTAILTPISAM